MRNSRSRAFRIPLHGAARKPACWQLDSPASLGINQLALIEDRTANFQVWNQPVVGYEVTKQDEIDAAKAMECVGAHGTTYTYNTSAKKLYEVRMTVSYVVGASLKRTRAGVQSVSVSARRP